MRSLILAFCGAVALGLSGAAAAQELQRVVAVVNDDVISMYDLATRTRLVVATSGMPSTPEVQNRVAPQVLRMLIDEKLQLQEAKRLNITVSTEEIQAALTSVARQNNVERDQLMNFLRQAGVPASALIQQMRAAVAWNKVVSQEIRPTIQVGEEEIQERLDQIQANLGQQESLVSEIFLTVDTPEQEDEVRVLGNRLIEQVKTGTDFAALAQQFSQSATAAVGGDLGWIPKGQIGAELDAAIDELSPGEISEPVRGASGFHILALRDRRKAALPGAEDSTVTIEQVFFSAEAVGATDELERLAEKAVDAASGAKSCSDMETLRGELEGTKKLLPDTLKLRDLSPLLRQQIERLSVGAVSQPITLPNGVLLIMVCEVESAARLPTTQEIRGRIVRERLNLLTRRQLRDIRRAAFVDVRI